MNNQKSNQTKNQLVIKELEDNKEQKNKEDVQKIINDFKIKYNGQLDYILTKNLIEHKGIDCVRACIDEFESYVDNANKVEKVFYDFTKKYGTKKAYKKSNTYRNTKPVQATNYEQREYDDEFFDSLYDNMHFLNKK